VHSSCTSRFRAQSRKLWTQKQQRWIREEQGHPLAVLVVESTGRRGDAEAPAGGELKHPGDAAAALPQSPRGRGGRIGAEALRRRCGSHLRRLPPESCGHLQEGPKTMSVRGA
jgi:hypothetical protein